MPKLEVHYPDLVARFEKAARNTMGMPVSIRELCRAAALNQRTLLRAVRAVHGMTPCHYLRALRLAEARQAFLCIDTPTTSVTEVALRCGFRELGRFAVDYRAKFGESPSDTLRRTTADRAAQSMASSRPMMRLPPDAPFGQT
jgi:transcriptional regulator GlxA family with amidase domain